MTTKKLFIPTKMKVGFNPREDTYTGKLGYIICEEKGKWRKENSWNDWRYKWIGEDCVDDFIKQRFTTSPESMVYSKFTNDETLKPLFIDNAPTEGFVLNKKVGGYSSGWNQRQTMARVFDPRGFEFEIKLDNLLFILQETNSIKGKGLEGEFVYAWDGPDLVLLPVTSVDYKDSMVFTNMRAMKLSTKELVVGHTYKTKQMYDVIYIGNHTAFAGYWKRRVNTGHWFVTTDYDKFQLLNVDALSMKISEDVPDGFATILERFVTKEILRKSNVSIRPITDLFSLDCLLMMVGDDEYEIYRNSISRWQRGYSRIIDFDGTSNKKLIFKNGIATIKKTTSKKLKLNTQSKLRDNLVLFYNNENELINF